MRKAAQKSARFNVEVDAAELMAYKKAAERKGLSMSAWARLLLREQAGYRP